MTTEPHPVVLTHPKAHRTLNGHRYQTHPDEPPIINVNGRIWWQTIWERQGWKVSNGPN